MSKFVYFGTPYVARDTLEKLVGAGYTPSLVITSPDSLKGRGLTLTPCETKSWAIEHGIPVLSPAALDEETIKEIAAYGCAYGIAVAYGKIIPQALIDAFPKGILNVHYSLLPKYRGASPVEMAIWNGDTVTGVTIQQMVFELDAGDILSQKEMAIDPADTTLTLRPKLITLGADLLIQTLPSFIDGSVAPTPQDASQATRAKKIKKEEGELFLSDDSRINLQNWNTYRALRESPGTYFFAEKEGKRIRVKITDATFKNGSFQILRIIPEGKSEQDFTWLAQTGWSVS
ncbi:MAG: methionyl-tRNA formyltransferase [Parcubacteria group bacterium]|nr:methionyl-tRNA formyltransferase [Parcubacteria group bacterium]